MRQWIARLLFLGLLPSLLLSACGGPSVPLGQIGNVEGDLGGAASDEPRATLVAEDILASGGTAADAATALYFTLAVTYPVAASLGGGGECIVYDTKTNKLENLQFFNQSPAAGGAIAIPGNIRGMAALQARYGRLEWSQLLAPAEQIAAFGEPLSRAQHMAMVVNRNQFILDYNIRNIFTDKDGNFVAEGTRLRQVRLAALLSALRSEGGASFYTGNWARTFVEDARIAGGDITVSDMVNYKPVWQDARSFRVDSNMVGLSTGRSGELFETLWKSLYDGKGILGVNVSIPEIDIARQTAELFSKVPDISPFISYGTTSFVTSDNQGGAVACVVGLGFPFGSGQMGEISGIVMAGNQGADMREFAASPMIMANITNKDIYYAGAASGGPSQRWRPSRRRSMCWRRDRHSIRQLRRRASSPWDRGFRCCMNPLWPLRMWRHCKANFPPPWKWTGWRLSTPSTAGMASCSTVFPVMIHAATACRWSAIRIAGG